MSSLANRLDLLRDQRRAALQGLARERGFSAIVVHAQGGTLGPASRSNAYLRLLLDWDGEDSASTLFLTEDICALVVSNPFQLPAARALRGLDLVIHAPLQHLGEALSRLARKRGGDLSGIVGLTGGAEMQAQTVEGLRSASATSFVDISNELDQWRITKTDAEIEALGSAAAVCDRLFAAFPQLLHEQRPTWKLQRELDHLGLLEGAEYCRTWITIAPTASGPRYLQRENLAEPAPGDQVLLGLTLRCQGFWGHGIRMGSLRHARAEHRGLYELVRAMFEAALPRFRPGVDLAEVEQGMDELYRRSAWGGVGSPPVTRFRSGHGLGLSYEEPSSSSSFPQYLDAWDSGVPTAMKAARDSVFELHPNLFVEGLGGAALGDMIHVTPDGPRRLLKTPLDFQVWGN